MKVKKWCLVGDKGEVKVFDKKPVKDYYYAGKEVHRTDYWIADRIYSYECSYWKLKRCEVKIL